MGREPCAQGRQGVRSSAGELGLIGETEPGRRHVSLGELSRSVSGLQMGCRRRGATATYPRCSAPAGLRGARLSRLPHLPSSSGRHWPPLGLLATPCGSEKLPAPPPSPPPAGLTGRFSPRLASKGSRQPGMAQRAESAGSGAGRGGAGLPRGSRRPDPHPLRLVVV